MLEFYEAYADYNDIAGRCERLIAYVASEVGYAGELDFTPPWRRETLAGAILDRTGIDILADRDREALAARCAPTGCRCPRTTGWPAAGRRAAVQAG